MPHLEDKITAGRSFASESPDPLVSVLVPVCNHAAFLGGCLDSIFNEDYQPLELIVVDDGSQDASLQIAQEWVRGHGHRFARAVVETQPNRGICKTYNRLVSLAQGEFVTVVDSDDELVRGGIRTRIAHLRSHPGQLAVFGRLTVFGDEPEAIRRRTEEYEHSRAAWRQPRLLTHQLLLHWNLAGPMMLCRRNAYDSQAGIGPYDERLSFEDLEFCLRLLARDALGYVDQVVARYRFHTGNNCRSEAHRQIADADYRLIYTENARRLKGLGRLILILKLWLFAGKCRRRIARQLLAAIRLAHALRRSSLLGT